MEFKKLINRLLGTKEEQPLLTTWEMSTLSNYIKLTVTNTETDETIKRLRQMENIKILSIEKHRIFATLDFRDSNTKMLDKTEELRKQGWKWG